MRPHGTPTSLERRRRRAIALLKTGRPYRSVATEVGASLSSVVRWHQTYRKRGLRGLRPKPNPGRPPLLTEKYKQKLVRILSRGSLEAGYSTDVWTLKRIGQVIQKHFGICYCTGNLWRLMDSLGWSCQKPTQKARERNEAALRYWKRTVSHIKKGPKAWSPVGFSG